METHVTKSESHINPDYVSSGNSGTYNPARSFCPEEFVPRRGLKNGHAQTLVSHFLTRRNTLCTAEQRLIRVEPDVQVLCLCHWQPDRTTAPAVLIVHGLEGSSDSQYVIGTANKAWELGYSVVRMNVRSCGGTEKLTPTLYHSGMSADIGSVVEHLIQRDGLPSVYLVGFSMGGNQVVKLAGEWGETYPAHVRGVAAVSPAMDLSISADALHLRQNRIYELRFLLGLRSRLKQKCVLFPGRYSVERWWWRSIRDFDDVVTAPMSGFKDAEDYYTRASSSRVLECIRIPTLIIHAKDDPFIRIAPSTYEKLEHNPAICFVETVHGGHCGFMAEPQGQYDGRWSEREVLRFVQHCEAHGR